MKLPALFLALLLCFVSGSPAHAEKKDDAEPLSELLGADAETPQKETGIPQLGTLFQWFGHAFVYLTSDSGIRIAINPYSSGIFDYTFPQALPADIVLISCESADYSGGKELFGLPQVFRSLAGVGLNNANGLTFRGVGTYRDDQRGQNLGGNTVYSFTLDGVRYCHLGAIGHTLTFKERSKIGKVDVLFLPVGNPILSESDLWKLADSLKPKWIVPVAYNTAKTQGLNFREFTTLDIRDRPVKHVEDSQFIFREEELPETTTLLLLKSP
jgi:L-ascorbate metabolism protein UlaG (beta-lactamase superfamily)